VDRRELKVAYLPELGRTNRTALAGALVAAFLADHEAKYPKATKALATENDKLMTHFELPAEHWKHLRTTNPIESTFATVKLRQRVTKGAGSRGAGLAMAYRLLLLAERSWRRLDAHELLPLVRAGVGFKDGIRVEREDGQVPVLAKRRLAVNKEKRGKVAA
jgi:putative transposase